MPYEVIDALTSRGITAYDIAIQEMDFMVVKKLTARIELGAGMRPLYFGNMRQAVPASKVGRRRIQRRITAVKLNLDKLHKWASEVAPQNDKELFSVARAMWVGLQGVKADLQTMEETLLLTIAIKKNLAKKGGIT